MSDCVCTAESLNRIKPQVKGTLQFSQSGLNRFGAGVNAQNLLKNQQSQELTRSQSTTAGQANRGRASQSYDRAAKDAGQNLQSMTQDIDHDTQPVEEHPKPQQRRTHTSILCNARGSSQTRFQM
jgi:hypothetical protein